MAMGAWLSVKSVAAVIDAFVKVTALAAALLAANFFLFRAEIGDQVATGQGVSQQLVVDAYRQANEELPLVVKATIADIHDGRRPSRYAYDGELVVARSELMCKFFPDQVRAVSGSDDACRTPGQSDRAVTNMSRAQILLIENNDTSFLYRDSKSWAVRNKQPTPTDASEIFPEAILNGADLGKAWSRIRIALVDQAMVTISNTGRADALDVKVYPPPGWTADQPEPFSVSAHDTVVREFSSAGASGTPTNDNFTVSWSSGISPIGGYIALAVVLVGSVALASGVIADLRRGPPATKQE